MNTYIVRILSMIIFSVFLSGCFDDGIYDIIKEENNSFPTHTTNFKISDTGQTKTYSLDGTDGSYSNTPGPLSFTDNGDGTISDNTTRLIWTKCSLSAEGEHESDGNCTLTPARYTWEEARDTCRRFDLGGLNWKLPTLHELTSTVMFWTSGKSDPAQNDLTFRPAFDKSYFPDTVYDIPDASWLAAIGWELYFVNLAVTDNNYSKYWTSTAQLHIDQGTMAYNINYYNGFSNIQSTLPANTNYIRCVAK